MLILFKKESIFVSKNNHSILIYTDKTKYIKKLFEEYLNSIEVFYLVNYVYKTGLFYYIWLRNFYNSILGLSLSVNCLSYFLILFPAK